MANINFTKTNFKSIADDGKGGSIIKNRDGYEFTAFAIDGNVYKMYVYHDEDGKWRVIDPMTGLSMVSGDTRAKAVEAATEPSSVMNFSNLIKTDKYGAMVDRFLDLASNGKVEPKPEPKPEPKAAPKKAKAKAPKAPKAPSKPKKSTPKKEAEPTVGNELVELIGKLAQLEKEIAELKAGKLTAEEEATAKAISDAALSKVAAEDSLSDTLRAMQKWCEDKPNVSAYRKNGGCVRVVGETKPYRQELNERGFRWSAKGFWYFGEREAKALAER